MARKMQIKWLSKPKAGNYPAAVSYLSLIYKPKEAARIVQRLRQASVAQFKSKDIFRASGLPLQGVSNFFVERDRHRILEGEALSPILLVRDPVHGRVVVADGYHRLCSVYAMDAEAPIPCKIV